MVRERAAKGKNTIVYDNTRGGGPSKGGCPGQQCYHQKYPPKGADLLFGKTDTTVTVVARWRRESEGGAGRE